MSEPNSIENRSRGAVVAAPKTPKQTKKSRGATGSNSSTMSDISGDNDGSSTRQLNGFNNQTQSLLDDQFESDSLVNHVQTITLNGYNGDGGGGGGNYDNDSERGTPTPITQQGIEAGVGIRENGDTGLKDVRRKRRSQSESSDGSPRSKNLQESDVGFMWTQTNGHHSDPHHRHHIVPVDPDPSPLSPDVFYSPAQEVVRPTDGMNGYVSANAHMLAYLDMNTRESRQAGNPDNINIVLPDNVNGVGAQNGNDIDDVDDDPQSDKIDEGIALAAELEYIPLVSTKLSTSSEDQGDFIETDISLQQMGFSSYASSRGSSCNDLPNLVQAFDRETHPQNYNNNVTKGNYGPVNKVQQHNTHAIACESCDRNQACSSAGAFNFSSFRRQSYECDNTGNFARSGNAQSSYSGFRQPNGAHSFQPSGRRESTGNVDEQGTPAPIWRNIGQPPLPLQRHPSTTNRSSTSSFYSPDLDVEFMDLDFEPGLGNSDSHSEISANELAAPIGWQPPENNQLGATAAATTSRRADRDKYSDNDENMDNCFCYGCDKMSDKFSNHSSHFKSCGGGSKGSALISCSRTACSSRHRKHQRLNSDAGTPNRENGESSDSVTQNKATCLNCDEQSGHPSASSGQPGTSYTQLGMSYAQLGTPTEVRTLGGNASELHNDINNECDSGQEADAQSLEGAVGFTSAHNGAQSHSVPNNLDMIGSTRDWNVLPDNAVAIETPAHYNVSRQTSTSNYDQDENNFQDYFGVESNLNCAESDSNSSPRGKDYFTRPKNVCMPEEVIAAPKSAPLLCGANLARLSCAHRQEAPTDGEDENEADDEQEEEDEGTPPPIPNTRPPLNRRLELLEAHNLNLEQNLERNRDHAENNLEQNLGHHLLHDLEQNLEPSRHNLGQNLEFHNLAQNLELNRGQNLRHNFSAFPTGGATSSLNSENQVLSGVVGGPDFRPGATNFTDDESPSRALHLLEYQFQSEELDFNTRRQVPRPNWLPSEDDSPLRALRFIEHELSSQSASSVEASRLSGEDGRRTDMSPTVSGGINNMDSLTDMFVVNLLRKKPLSRRGRLLVTEEGDDGSVAKVMIWSEYEAYVLQVKQIGVSACGATAVINVLKAFDIYPDKTAVCKAVKTNLRAEMSSVPEYLISRSVAGTTAHHLIEGIDELTSGDIFGRFFHFWPPRNLDLKDWLADWMKKGAVPVVTLNLQKGVPPEAQIPDAWHHQMVYGVGPKGIYLTNPLDVVAESAIYDQLTSDSVLLVRRSDIIRRWTNSSNLAVLLNHSDSRWLTMNVAGQVVNAMRECNRPRIPGFRPQQTSHVLIPAFYKAGVTLFVKRDSPVYNELLKARDIPLKKDGENSAQFATLEQRGYCGAASVGGSGLKYSKSAASSGRVKESKSTNVNVVHPVQSNAQLPRQPPEQLPQLSTESTQQSIQSFMNPVGQPTVQTQPAREPASQLSQSPVDRLAQQHQGQPDVRPLTQLPFLQPPVELPSAQPSGQPQVMPLAQSVSQPTEMQTSSPSLESAPVQGDKPQPSTSTGCTVTTTESQS